MSRSYRKNFIWKYHDKEMDRICNHKIRQRLKRMDDCFTKPGTFKRIQYDDQYCDFSSYAGWNSEKEWMDLHRPYYDTEKECRKDFMRIWKSK